MRILLLLIFGALAPFWPIGAEVLPGDPLIIVNKRSNEIAFINGGAVIMQEIAATGKTNDLTPEGLFTVTVKAVNPYYRKKNIPGGHPRNPLGSRWIGFDARGTDGRTYGLHGTNQPSSIGKYISEGCIRLSAGFLEKLYNEVPVGSKILIVHSDQSFEQLAREIGAIQK